VLQQPAADSQTDYVLDAVAAAAQHAVQQLWEDLQGVQAQLRRGGRLSEAELAQFAAPLQLSKQWAKFKEWRHNKWTREDIEPQYPLYLKPQNGTDNAKGTKKHTDYDMQVDTIDVVRVIKGDKNAR
jgi:hypothetical protein